MQTQRTTLKSIRVKIYNQKHCMRIYNINTDTHNFRFIFSYSGKVLNICIQNTENPIFFALFIIYTTNITLTFLAHNTILRTPIIF